jgi:hypothetical protein
VAVGINAGYSLSTGTVAWNTVVGTTAGYSVTTGVGNTLIGGNSTRQSGAGYYITTGSNNTVLGGYDGNQGGLDIRTLSNRIVLSDGDGNPRGYFDDNGNFFVGAFTLTNTGSYFAYSPGNTFADFGHATGVASGVSYQRFFYNGNLIGNVAQDGTGAVAYNTLGTPANGAQLNQTGITFPATQSASSNANTLDDYEEGTWTPTVFGETTAGTTSYTIQTGRYTKIGNLVTCIFRVDWTSATGTGYINIGGLPFTSENVVNAYGGGPINGMGTATVYGANNTQVLQISNNVSYMRVMNIPVGGGQDAPAAVQATGIILATVVYRSA